VRFAFSIALLSSPAFAGFDRQELEVPGMTLWVASGDLDGDRATDIIASYRRGSGPSAARFIAVFFRGADGYGRRPDAAFAAPKSAAIFDVGNAIGDAKDEILYLTSTGVFAQAFVGRKPAAPVRIVSAPTLAGAPEEEDFPYWDFARDVPGLGRVMLVPSRTKMAIFREKDGAWTRWSSIAIDQYSYYDAETTTYRRSAQGGSSGRPYSLRITTVVPTMDLVEQTGDQRIDLVTHYDDRIAVYPQGEDGVIAEKPAHRQWMKVLTPQELENRDTGLSAEVQDLDADGVADLTITKIGGGITTLASEVRIYRGRSGGGFEETPAQVFKDDGFAALTRFIDVDGDGRVDMIHPHAEVSIVSISSAMLSSKLGLDVRLRRSAPKPSFFDPKPVQVLDTSFGLDLSVGASLRGAAPIFGHDFDGDGANDVLVSDSGDKMLLLRGKKGGGEPFESDGNVTLTAEGSNTTIVLEPAVGDRRKPDVLVYYVARQGMSGRLVVFRNRF
jgi:hypothetical protein